MWLTGPKPRCSSASLRELVPDRGSEGAKTKGLHSQEGRISDVFFDITLKGESIEVERRAI